jgi:tRNA threonylcarbamoyladenosine biosynthesis protein TsaB
LNILVIETATSIELLAASADGRTSDRTAISRVSHSVTLFANIDAALGELGIGIRDIELMGVGVGPGSFTGIRIAVSTARMLAQALGVPLVPVKSQLLYAASAAAGPGEYVLVAFDAKKGRVFGALYRASDDPLSPTEVVAPGDYDIERLCEPARGKRTLAVGDGAEKYRAEIEKRLPECAVLADFMPSGEAACRIVGNAYAANPAGYPDIGAVLPFYARKSDAEVIREEKINGKRGG